METADMMRVARMVRPYLASLGILAVATAARAALAPALGIQFPLLTYWPAVELVAYYFGFGPALFSIGISLALSRRLFMLHTRPFLLPTRDEWVTILLFVIFTSTMAKLMDILREATTKAESNADLARQRQVELLAEVEARRQERYWAESVLESIGDGVIAADVRGAVTYMNDTAELLTGWRLSDAAGEQVGKVFHLVEEAPFSRLFARDGRAIPVEHNERLIRNLRDRTLGTVRVFRDVSAGKLAQDALEAGRRTLDESLQAAGAAAWEWNAATGRISCSAEFRKLTAVGGQAHDVDVEDWIHAAKPADQARFRAELETALLHGGDLHVEYRAIAGGKAEGEIKWLAALGKMTETGRMSGIVMDVTARRRLEEKLRNAAKQESLSILSGGIAHDFNNLLTSILGYASLMQADAEPGSPVASYAGRIEAASHHAAHLTRQMLAYAGEGRFSVEEVDVSQAVREALEEDCPPRDSHIRVEMRLAPALPRVCIDPRQLTQVICNVVLNAYEAIGPEGTPGCVTLSTYAQHIGEGEAASERPPVGSYVVIEVRDTGMGMDDATKANIFDPFFTTKFTGRGLGLAAVLGIVRGHAGAIHVESAPGQGTVFQTFWPVTGRPTGSAA